MSADIVLDIRDGVAALTLNRPGAGNAIDSTFGAAFGAALDTISADTTVRAVLLTGSGRTFCVGGDIGEMVGAASLPGLMESSIPPLHAAIARLAALRCPIVTAINGPVGGGGIALALCGDFVLGARSMKLRGGYAAIGLSPDLGASWYLARRAGAAQAKRILFLNQPVGAEECLALGLIDALHPDERLADEAQSLARTLATGATGSFARIRELVDGAASRTLPQQLDMEACHMIAAAGSTDAREGVRAFIEKRPARFCGR